MSDSDDVTPRVSVGYPPESPLLRPFVSLVPPPRDAAEGVTVSDLLPKPASPTGLPLIPPKAVPYLVTLVGLAYVVAEQFPGTLQGKVAGAIVALAGLFGIVSPGLRKS